MPSTINPVSIFVPMLVVVALTFVGFVRMAAGRGRAVKGGHDPAYYKAQIGTPEPEFTVVGVRHYGNLFELPTIFYAACLTAYVLAAVGTWTLVFAWAYVVFRLVQSMVHLTYNNPAHRGMAFVLGVLSTFALWITLAIAIFARL
jgi:hypothetical protein